MKQVRSKTREEWVKYALGARSRLTVRQMERTLRLQDFNGWISAMLAEGPAYEQIAMILKEHPLAFVVLEYRRGNRWFNIDALQQALGAAIDTRKGADRLAKIGFAVISASGDMVQLRAADPRSARFVNESRCCPQIRGYSVRRVLEAILSIRRPGTSRVNLTDDRRLRLAETLFQEWLIRCDDALTGRLRIRLFSTWTFPNGA